MTTREFPDISFGKIATQPHTSLCMQDMIQRRRRNKHVQTEEGPTEVRRTIQKREMRKRYKLKEIKL